MQSKAAILNTPSKGVRCALLIRMSFCANVVTVVLQRRQSVLKPLPKVAPAPYLKEAFLIRRHVIQRDVGFTRLLANQHGMPLAECSSANILPTQANVKTWT